MLKLLLLSGITCLAIFARASAPTQRIRAGCMGSLSTNRGDTVSLQELSRSAQKMEALIRNTMRKSRKLYDERLVSVITPWIKAQPKRIQMIVGDFGRGTLPSELIEDPEMREMANVVQRAFTDAEQSSKFFANLYSEIVQRAGVTGRWDNSWDFVSANSEHAPQAIREIAMERGFDREVEIPKDGKFLEGTQFRDQYLKPLTVIIDRAVGGISPHGVYSHYFQMLFAKEILDAKFGEGAFEKFHSFLSTEKGFKVWTLMFDLGPVFSEHPGHPRFFTQTKLSGHGPTGLP